MPVVAVSRERSARKIIGLLFLEGLLIFAGVTASFWAEEWRERRDDLDTYRHLLEEIYFNATIDESGLPIGIGSNNLALKYALELVVLDVPLSSDPPLYVRLDHVFGDATSTVNTAGYVRLSNTSLRIPYDETTVALDNAFLMLANTTATMERTNEEIGELRAAHWRSAGMISCTGESANDGSQVLMDRPYMAEIRDLLYEADRCIAEEENEARARALILQPEFRSAVRQVIDLRQQLAYGFGWQQMTLDAIQAAIETRVPDVRLPVASMELMSWPEVTTEQTERRTAMRRTGTDSWEATLDLDPGYVKFRANGDWSVNWGAPFPNIIDAPWFFFNSERIRVDDVFPAGTAHLNGMNLPVRGGTYRVTFDSRTGAYRFDPVEAGS